MMPIYDLVLMILGVFFAFCMMSYIWAGTSIWFDIAESVYIGGFAAAGIYSASDTLTASGFNQIAAGKTWVALFLFIGILVLTRLTRFRWLARYPIALMSGVGLGVMVGLTVRSQILVAASATVSDILSGYDPNKLGAIGASVSNVLVLIGVVTVLAYFMYSARYSSALHTGRLRYITTIGRMFIFASFGYLYSSIFFAEGIDLIVSKLIVLVQRVAYQIMAS